MTRLSRISELVQEAPMLKPIQARDMLQRLVEHALTTGLTIDDLFLAVRKAMIEEALKLDRGNQCKAAKRLQVHRNTLHRHIVECGVSHQG